MSFVSLLSQVAKYISPPKKPKIALVTLCIGKEYSEVVAPGKAIKEEYCQLHGYDLYFGGEEFFDNTRPISWFKIPFILGVLNSYDIVFFSDADVLITNMHIKLEDIVEKHFPKNKDFLACIDGCGVVNIGNFFIRNTKKAKVLLNKMYEQTQFIDHCWWENKAFIHLLETSKLMKKSTEIISDNRLFNSYVDGRNNYKKGDFILHFANIQGKRLKDLMTYSP